MKIAERDRLQTQICRHTDRKIAERDRLQTQYVDNHAGKMRSIQDKNTSQKERRADKYSLLTQADR
jgi:hypothetical protein